MGLRANHGRNAHGSEPTEGAYAQCDRMTASADDPFDGEDLQSTSFVGWFDDLASLEAWSKSHSTHLAIFHSFLSTMHLLGRPPKLRLWHEVSVLPEGGVELVRSDLSPLAELLS